MSDEHFVSKSWTLEADKDLWQTPKALYDALDKEFEFDLDAFASEENKLAPCFFDAEFSALENEWDKPHDPSEHGRIKSAFVNPPYSQTQLCLYTAMKQAKKHNITVVALVNANTDTQWFSEAVKTANEIRLITGRVGFVGSSGKKVNGNTKGQCLIIWRGKCSTPCQITMVDRNKLMKGA